MKKFFKKVIVKLVLLYYNMCKFCCHDNRIDSYKGEIENVIATIRSVACR